MQKLLLFDYDFTIFNTALFWQDFASAIARVTGADAQQYVRSYETFVSGQGRSRLIDYGAVLQKVGITHEQITPVLQQITHGKDYAYADAKELLVTVAERQDCEVQILTFGETQFQEIKLALVPEIAQYKRSIIQKLKTDFIAESFPGRQGALIDDKPDQQLPVGWTEIHIDRKAGAPHKPLQVSEHVWRITSLADAEPLL